MLNTTILNSTYLRDNEILHPEDCKPGCEIFGYCQDSQGIIFCQYCYRFQTDGELFLTTQPTLADCHKELDISRKFISLVHELDIISDQSPKRRYLLDLLEKLSDNEIEKLISLIEQEVLSDKGGKDV